MNHGSDAPGSGTERAEQHLQRLGIVHRITRHPRVRSLAEAAAQRGLEPRDLVKSMVVRRTAGSYLFVLVPGDREIAWPKLRSLLETNRLSMPDAQQALEVTGYARGTITPFGAHGSLPVVADERLRGRDVAVGAGEFGASVHLRADDALAALDAIIADVTEPT